MNKVLGLLAGAGILFAVQAQGALPIPAGWESIAMPEGVMAGWVAPNSIQQKTEAGHRTAAGDFLTIQTNQAGVSYYVVTNFIANCDEQKLKKRSDKVYDASFTMVANSPASAPWINVYKSQTPAEYVVHERLCSSWNE